MLGRVVLDPTAGERARRINEVPTRPCPITDPTDPRYGLPAGGEGQLVSPHPDELDEDPTFDEAA